MASAAEDTFEDALGDLVNMTEKCANLRNDLWKDILRAASNIRKEFAKLRCEVEDKHKLIVDLEKKAAETHSTLKALQCVVGGNCREDKGATCWGASDLQGQRLERGSFCCPNEEALLRRCGR